VEQRRFSLSYKKNKSASPQIVMETAVRIQRSKKGNISLFRGNNESGYILVIYNKEPEDRNDSDISRNTVGIP